MLIMGSVTTVYEKSVADGWFKVADGAVNVSGQLRNKGVVEFVTASAIPVTDVTTATGFILSRPGGETTFSFGSLDGTENTYARALADDTVFSVMQDGNAL